MKVSVKNEIWPNFFIVGAMKSGTTSLYHYLTKVNGVFMSLIKEPNYFASEDFPSNTYLEVVRKKDDYLSLFSNAKDAVAIGEASTNYLYSERAAFRIQEFIPNAKIIAILRDPIERAYSHYLQYVRNKYENAHNLSFLEAVRKDYELTNKGIGVSALYVEKGLYYQQVKRYLDLFGRENVKILFFEEFINYPYEHVAKVLEFLRVCPDVPDNVGRVYNKTYIPNSKFGKSLISSKILADTIRAIPEPIKKQMRKYILSNFHESNLKNQMRRYIVGEAAEVHEIPLDGKDYLQEIYRDDVRQLSTLLRRPIPWKGLF